MITTVLDQQGRVDFEEGIFPEALLGTLKECIDWRQNNITIFGKTHPEPRLTAWYGPPYQYSSIIWEKKAFPPILEELKHEVESRCRFSFNAVLCNYYRSGIDYMGWHRDNEAVNDQSCIASVSFGAERAFQMRHRTNRVKYEWLLKSGSLLVMRDCQDLWEHALPKRLRVPEPRLNLTFRKVHV